MQKLVSSTMQASLKKGLPDDLSVHHRKSMPPNNHRF